MPIRIQMAGIDTRRLRPSDDCGGLQDRVHGTVDPVPPRSPKSCSSNTRAEDGSWGRDSVYASQEGNCEVSGTGSQFAGFLLPHVHEEKILRGLATHPQSETIEQVHKSEKVPHGYDSYSGCKPAHRRVGHIDRPARCILPHSYPPGPSQIHAVRGGRKRLPVSGTPLRVINRTKGVHKSRKDFDSLLKKKRSQNILLFRRLAYRAQKSRSLKRSHKVGSHRDRTCRFHNKSGQVRARANSETHIPRSRARYGERVGTTIPGQSAHSGTLRTRPFERGFRPGSVLAANAGQTGVLQGTSPEKHATHASLAALSAKSVEPNTAYVSGGRFSSHTEAPLGVVAGQGQHSERGPLPSRGTIRSINDGCLLRGVGGAHRRPTGGRLMGAGREVGAYQYAGAQSSLPSSQTLRTTSDGSHGVGSVGQHDGGGIHKQAGRDKVLVPVSFSLGPLRLVLDQSGPARSLSLAREAKLPCGRSLQREDQSDRMEPAQRHSAASVPVARETQHRPVCKQGECEAPNVLHEVPGQHVLGDRRVQHQLGGDVRVCVSPHLTDPQSSDEIGGGTLSDAPHSSAMAETTLVSNTGVVPRESPPGSPGEGGSLESGEEVVSPAREPTLDCVASVKQSFRQAGLSEQAASLATAARRESTLRVYSSRVRHWDEWCTQGGHDPHHAPVKIVAEYLTQLFHKGFQTNTIAGYRSAIGSIHKGFEDGSTVSTNTTIHSVVKGAFTLRPPVQRLVPQWSLTLVLRRLAEAPYEPLGRASLKLLTFKCGFLLALATGRRSSQITALSVHPDHLVWTKQGVRMTPHLGFLAKNQRLNFTPEPISLQEMKYHSDTREDKLWCPVRALKFYVDRTKALRRDCNQLFIKTVKPHDGVKTVTFASWIVQTIKAAYGPGEAPGVQAHAHDVRGVSASWAKFNNVALIDILRAAAWNTPSTFTTCYVKDIFAAEGQYGLQVVAAAAKSASNTGR